jgi:hypothetical protein
MVQIANVAEMLDVNADALSIEPDSVSDCVRSGVLDRERGEIELIPANAMCQLDAMKPWSRHS